MSNNEVEVADWFAEDFNELQEDPDYVTHDLLIDIAVQLGEIMEEEGIDSQKELANRLGMSPSAISQIMSGDQNMSVERIVRIALALGRSVNIDLVEHTSPDVTPVPTKTTRIDLTEEEPSQKGGAWDVTRKDGVSWPDRAQNKSSVSVCVGVN